MARVTTKETVFVLRMSGGGRGGEGRDESKSKSHYVNKLRQVNPIFHGSKNSIFQMKTFNIFLFMVQTLIAGVCLNRPNESVKDISWWVSMNERYRAGVSIARTPDYQSNTHITKQLVPGPASFLYARRDVLCYTPGRPSGRAGVCPSVILYGLLLLHLWRDFNETFRYCSLWFEEVERLFVFK